MHVCLFINTYVHAVAYICVKKFSPSECDGLLTSYLSRRTHVSFFFFFSFFEKITSDLYTIVIFVMILLMSCEKLKQ